MRPAHHRVASLRGQWARSSGRRDERLAITPFASIFRPNAEQRLQNVIEAPRHRPKQPAARRRVPTTRAALRTAGLAARRSTDRTGARAAGGGNLLATDSTHPFAPVVPHTHKSQQGHGRRSDGVPPAVAGECRWARRGSRWPRRRWSWPAAGHRSTRTSPTRPTARTSGSPARGGRSTPRRSTRRWASTPPSRTPSAASGSRATTPTPRPSPDHLFGASAAAPAMFVGVQDVPTTAARLISRSTSCVTCSTRCRPAAPAAGRRRPDVAVHRLQRGRATKCSRPATGCAGCTPCSATASRAARRR